MLLYIGLLERPLEQTTPVINHYLVRSAYIRKEYHSTQWAGCNPPPPKCVVAHVPSSCGAELFLQYVRALLIGIVVPHGAWMYGSGPLAVQRWAARGVRWPSGTHCFFA